MRKLALTVGGLIAALVVVFLGANASWAQGTESEENIRGVLKFEGEAVVGVTITVATADGEEVGTTESDAEGAWQIPVPGPGDYEVTLDAATLPSTVPGVAEETISTTVNSLQDKAVLFRLGAEAGPSDGGETGTETGVPGEESEETATPSQVWQLLANGIRFGLILGLASLGLSLVFGTTGLTNFAHGELITLGAILAWWFNQGMGLPLILAAALAVIASGVFGWAQDAGFWRPLRRRKTGLIALMIISIGFSLVLRYFFLWRFGSQRESYDQYVIQRAIDFGPFGVTPRDFWLMGISVVVLALVAVALVRTRMGKATRAVADNPALASASGIDVDRVISVVWIVGTALAGLSGVLFGLIQQIDWLMGFRALLLVFAAVILGGLGT
ncbi:MAG: branched-chain amino acid ABC transporter permease, partial [Jiangellaceae bacterium]